MTDILLQTKLYIPPVRTSLVPRPRLIEKLNAGLSGKLTVLSAPAGFGKTTLMGEWLAQLKRPFGWLSLDEGDNDPHRFFTYINAALMTVSDDIDRIQPASDLPIKAMTTLLVNNLIQLSHPSVLVLDDYHLIEIEAIHEAITFFCDHLPAMLHLVLITRSDPPLPLARMRVRGELNEIRESDLRFMLEETAVFLNQIMGLHLTPQNIADLEVRTEGWIASLQLAALSLKDAPDATQLINAFNGTHRFIIDYLVEEVLVQRPSGTREFLLKTSMLHRLSAPLCDELLASTQSQETLEQLDAANFFLIPLDSQRRWYRYHHLFADVLRQHALQAYPTELPTLYQRAAHWFEANEFLNDAIEMALAGKDFEMAANLIQRAAETVIWDQGEWLLLDRWLTTLPESHLKTQPRLMLYRAWGSFVRGQFAAFKVQLTEAAEHLFASPQPNALAMGEMAAIRASAARFQGNPTQVIAQADIALSQLPQAESNWRVMTLLNIGAAHFLRDNQAAAEVALTQVWQLAQAENQAMWGSVSGSFLAQLQMRNGRYHEAAHLYRQARALTIPQPKSVFNMGMIYVGLGELWLAWNDLDKAEALLRQGLDIGTAVQNILLIMSGALALASLRQIQDRLDEAKALILQAQQIALIPIASWTWVHVPTAAHLARVWIKQGDLNEARRLLETAVADATNQPDFWMGSLQIAQVRLLCAEGNWTEADSLLVALWETADQHNQVQNQIEIRILQAVTQQKLQHPDQARAHLEAALVLARPSGNIRLFLDEGAAIQDILVKLKFEEASLQAYAQKISDAFPKQQKKASESANQQLIEPLTARELELLALVATGVSNRDIAAQLFISYGTVRRHLNNIYGKLAVNGRSQAILKAQDLNLV